MPSAGCARTGIGGYRGGRGFGAPSGSGAWLRRMGGAGSPWGLGRGGGGRTLPRRACPGEEMGCENQAGRRQLRALTETCQMGANMWNASAISSRTAMSNWAPRCRSTGRLRKPSTPPAEDGAASPGALCACAPGGRGVGSQRMRREARAVRTAERMSACLRREQGVGGGEVRVGVGFKTWLGRRSACQGRE
eukprot:scaffold12322_cov110-Isochrysis_galbana.AAC.3